MYWGNFDFCGCFVGGLLFFEIKVFYPQNKNPQHVVCQGFEPLSIETYIDRVPIGELAF